MLLRSLIAATVFTCLYTASSVYAEPPALLDDIAARIHIQDQAQGSFTQAKHLPFLDQPLVSSGYYSISSDTGLSWQVVEPVQSLMQVHSNKVWLDGQQVNDRGMGAAMYRIMQAVMSGQLDQLSREFSVAGDIHPQHWQLNLQPRSRWAAKVISQIRLSGDTAISDITVYETSGARTVMHLIDGVQPSTKAK